MIHIIVLKVTNFGEDQLNCLRPLGGILAPSQNRVKYGLGRTYAIRNAQDTKIYPGKLKFSPVNISPNSKGLYGKYAKEKQTLIDDYAKDGGPREIQLLCSFYHEPLRT